MSVVTASGEVLEHEPVTHAKGSWQKPLSREELEAKFRDCAAGAIGAGQATALFASALADRDAGLASGP